MLKLKKKNKFIIRILLFLIINVFIGIINFRNLCQNSFGLEWVLISIILAKLVFFKIDYKSEWEEIFILFVAAIILFIAVGGEAYVKKNYIREHSSLVVLGKIDSVYFQGGKTGRAMYGIIHPNIGINKIFCKLNYNINYKSCIGKFIYCIYPIDCKNFDIYQYSDYHGEYGNFAFLENKKLYTYHDYSLLKPDLVYYNVGFNIMYKSTKHIVNDSVINLYFTEIEGTSKKVSYKPNYDISEIDTFLVFKNINEKFEDTWHVCAPDINTPENWAKISDYGYIFHYNIYSRHEIEDSCQQIRNYVLKYKERLEKHL